MNSPQQIVTLMNQMIALIRKSDPHAHPMVAIMGGALAAAFKIGMVEPVHVYIADCKGNGVRSTIQQAVIRYVDSNGWENLQFPLRVVVSDEAGIRKLEVTIKTEQINGDWVFHTTIQHVSGGMDYEPAHPESVKS